MFQLSTELLNYAMEFESLKASTLFQNMEQFNIAWVFVMAVLWLSLRQTLQTFSANPGRVIALLHALCICVCGLPVIFLLGSESFTFSSMYQNFLGNATSIKTTSNVVCYVSVGYFLMDSFFLVRKTYLRHHIGAMTIFLISAYHHHTSIIHGVCVVALFETGAILVQMSRAFPNIYFRTFVCIGYTLTRITLGWYYFFIFYTTMQFWDTISTIMQLSYLPMYAGLIYLLKMNFTWCGLQWKALFEAIKAPKDKRTDFYSYHQKIIGNTN